MEICKRDDALEIAQLDPFLAELLRQIPESASPEGNDAAAERIFSPPMNAPEEKLCAEWKNYVEPELRRLFDGATATVADDLLQLNGARHKLSNCTLSIPVAHADDWLNALNRARLVLACKNDFTEEELGDHFRSPIGSRRDLSLFQVNFYGFLQECILRQVLGYGGEQD